jgi:signal transduction histidine kinase
VLDEPQRPDRAAPYPPASPRDTQDTATPASHARMGEQGMTPLPDARLETLREMLGLQYGESPARDRLTHALQLAMRLLPGAHCLRLFLPAEHSPQAQAFEVLKSDGRTSGRTTSTLGYGEATDDEVLRHHQTVRLPRATVMPLPGRVREAPGALVVDWQAGDERGQDEPMLALVVEQLASLVGSVERERRDARTAGALERLERTTGEAVPEDLMPERAGQPSPLERGPLRETLEALRQLTGTAAGTVLSVGAQGLLSTDGGIRLEPGATDALDEALRAADPLQMSQGHALWDALQAVRDALSQRSHAPITRLTLYPVRHGETLAGVIILADGPEHQDRGQQLLARAIIRAAEQRLAYRRLAAAARAQGQAFDVFISMAAHELRSPLTSVMGYAQLLVRQVRRNAQPEAVACSAAEIVEQAARLADMIEQLHDAARIRRGKLEIKTARTDLVPLVRGRAEQWRAAFPEHQIHVNVEADTLAGNWDAGRLTQVLRNLLENAARFSPSGGGIFVTVARHGDEALVSVRDEGVGILGQDRPHIFEYLYRSPAAEARNLSGLGLGLFVSRHLVERMGGRLWLQRSSAGLKSGSEFRFELPLAGGEDSTGLP